MKHNVLNILEDVTIAGGIAVSLPMIETILGIIILSVQVILIIYKATMKIIELMKKKKYDEIDDALEDTKDQLEDLKDKNGKHWYTFTMVIWI